MLKNGLDEVERELNAMQVQPKPSRINFSRNQPPRPQPKSPDPRPQPHNPTPFKTVHHHRDSNQIKSLMTVISGHLDLAPSVILTVYVGPQRTILNI